jgi:hypothetical protein
MLSFTISTSSVWGIISNASRSITLSRELPTTATSSCQEFNVHVLCLHTKTLTNC